MTIDESTQLLSKEASVKLLADMLQQAEEDKTVLLEALDAARGRLDANAAYIMRSTRNAGNDGLYAKAVTVWANEARSANEKVEKGS